MPQKDLFLGDRPAKPVIVVPNKATFTVPEVAVLMGLSTRTIYYFLQRGVCSGVRPTERTTRIPREEVLKLVAAWDPDA